MTLKDLQLIKTMLTSGNCPTEEETKNLLISIESELYRKQIRSFKQHLIDTLPIDSSSDEELNNFYSHDFVISFAGKTVTINNEVFIHDAMCELLDKYIELCLWCKNTADICLLYFSALLCSAVQFSMNVTFTQCSSAYAE